ncbi:hypothetical protein G7Z12_37590 [Streptomyces sp. ID38640]|uniref:hypothetical protein n=1 Tax=Streptomyces sp. ID38640 TaxID=1265399 RepID=UPI00140EA1D1|nr:hypothetical protein [Streptomyces sp. ID38640]QIK04731.1 hypothetical protein G7Z12_00150 [Streptomyces sp. ID38640]QIK10896.1 hypothetical protein G7Z12_37445 [Streptomyces sp. ID38640]QIK10915.1 hypothetical protein G7Z12_37590 [Streptomyces sp. ID38640]
MLGVTPAYPSDTGAADVLTSLCDAIGEELEHGLAAGRYSLTGDRRVLHSIVL